MKIFFRIILRFFGFFIRGLGRLSHLIFNPDLSRNLSFVFNVLYSGRISRSLKLSGKNLLISYPLYLLGGKNISIGDNFISYSRLRLEAHTSFLTQIFNPILSIGNNVAINYDCHIGCINKVIIGDNVLIASKVFITDHFHGNTTKDIIGTPPSQRKLISKGPVIIENNVWIGENVSIMPNVIIGENSIIGANSVVTKSVPKNTVVAGIPAIIIKTI
ncbi:DapH/DapD/GlmU-related protein [Pedobacter nutrimenti]|uniref:DapH/DapD/GlmU-related protein n=1 Tax=Pedobacter nutrimenti TaxID=1241337 RepID=UPI00292E40E9|nr:DapH/DapD/GlmU-related protein [Pedobacter nutrimenti]